MRCLEDRAVPTVQPTGASFFFSYAEKAIGRQVFKSRVIGSVSKNLGGEITIDYVGISATLRETEIFRAKIPDKVLGKKKKTVPVIRTIE